MLLLELILTLALLAVCAFTPGFFLVRRVSAGIRSRNSCASIGLSLLLLFLASWLVYLFTSGTPRIPFWCISAVCLALGIAARQDIARLSRARQVRQAVGAFGFLLLWTLLILGLIRNYSGGAWFGDWLEHFQRSLFFLHHFPLRTVLLGDYTLPARPPMANILAAFFLAQIEDRFEIFQLVFVFLNLLVFLPCCLIMPALAGPRRRRILPLLCLFALNPVVIQNATYTWTKLFAAFYVVLALGLYLAGWRKKDRWRIGAAFLALSAGMLAHYSAAPYLLLLAGHYLFFVFPSRPRKWREIASIAGICALPLLAWLGWSIQTYGVNATFASNTTVTSSRRYQGDAAGKFFGNLFDSLVPAVLRDPSVVQTFDQPNTAGAIRDNAFAFYQPNLIFGMGLVGGPLVVSLLYAAFERRRSSGPEGRFWLGFIPCCILGGNPGGGRARSVGRRSPGAALFGSDGAGAAGGPYATAAHAGGSAGGRLHCRFLPGYRFTGASGESGKYAGANRLLRLDGGRWKLPRRRSGTALPLRNRRPELVSQTSVRTVRAVACPTGAVSRKGCRPRSRWRANWTHSWLRTATGWDGWCIRAHNGSVQFLGDHVTSSPAMAGAVALLLLALFGAVLRKLWEGAAG